VQLFLVNIVCPDRRDRLLEALKVILASVLFVIERGEKISKLFKTNIAAVIFIDEHKDVI